MKKVLLTSILVGTIAGLSCCFLMDVQMKKEKAETVFETETESVVTETTQQDYIYIICDVTETNHDTFTALMPNGELHIYNMIEDYPVDENNNPCFTLVCFRVDKGNQDDYTMYEVVAIR
jgi:hypothetical protein